MDPRHLHKNLHRRRRQATPALALALVVSATSLHAAGPVLAPPAGAARAPVAPWHVVGLPNQTKPFTRYSVVSLDGVRAVRVEADNSYGNLVHAVQEPQGSHRLSWRWRLDEANPASNLRTKDGDDSPVKVCALFDLPIDVVPFVERQLLRVARMGTTEPLPAASVCYVWDSHLPPGTVIDNAFSRRIRFVVVRGPEAPLGTWMNEQRDVWADFKRLFADESSDIPPLVGVAIGADADNTHRHSLAHVATITLD